MQEVERFRKRARVHHWWIAVWALILGLTGLFLFVDGFSAVAEGGGSRLVHRIAAICFVAGPGLYFFMNAKSSWEWIRDAFSRSTEDIGWLNAAPSYYFGGPEEAMPPQEWSNTGQKLWTVVAITTGLIFVITGFFMWFLKGNISPGTYQVMLLLHDIAFIFAGAMFLVHFALAVFHPRMSEAMRSMIWGKSTVHYAKTHHGKWYDRISAGKSS